MLRKNTSSSTPNKEKIPLSLYKKIVASVPICCVDAVFKSGNKVYLFKRAYEPAKNEWWLVGGRILKGEGLKAAVIRKAKEEIGVDVNIVKMIGVYEEFFTTSFFDKDAKGRKSGTHTLSVCYVVEPKKHNFGLRLNEEYNGYKTITKIDKGFHPYIKRVLRDSGLGLR